MDFLRQFFLEHLTDGEAVQAVHVDQTVDVLALLSARTAEYEHNRRRQLRYLTATQNDEIE